MHKLTYTALSIMLVLVILACEDEQTTISMGYASPEEASVAFQEAVKAEDWESVVACLTPESRDMSATILVVMAGFLAMDEQKSETVHAILEKHGLDMEDESAAFDPDEDTQSPAQVIKDRDGFIAEMMEIGGEDIEIVVGKLADLEIDEDTATGVWLTDDEEEESVEFRRIDGRWYVHMPERGIFPADDDSTITPPGGISDQPTYDAELFITYWEKGLLQKGRQPLVPALRYLDLEIGEDKTQNRIIPVFMKHENRNDVYQIERIFPFGHPEAQSSIHAVKFSGTPVTVFEDETLKVALHARTVYTVMDQNGNIARMMDISDPELPVGRLTDLKIDGDTATGVLLAPDGEEGTIEFEKIDGSWYVKEE
ncbi:hypothetical protein ACFL6S_08935 [Candidatus Poribacteria bacterium]